MHFQSHEGQKVYFTFVLVNETNQEILMSKIKPVDFEVNWCIFKVTEVRNVYFAFVVVTETNQEILT